MITDTKKIEDTIKKATEMNGTYTGMSYEQGIIDALDWILEDDENGDELL